MKTFFKKLEDRFLVESSKSENASFPYKTNVSEDNVKTNTMVSRKWAYHKERSFASNYFIFFRFWFTLRTSWEELICCTNNPNAHICTFCKRWSFIGRCFFPWVSLKAWYWSQFFRSSHNNETVIWAFVGIQY